MKKTVEDIQNMVHDLMNWEWAKDRLTIRVKNEAWERRKDCLTRTHEGLTIVPYVVVDSDDKSEMSTAVTRDLAMIWQKESNVSKQDIFEQAFTNDAELGIVIRPYVPGSPMWVVSNPENRFGANVVYQRGALQLIQEVVGEDYWLLPSSVHDWIALPQSFAPAEDLLDMVKEVNANVVPEDEVLTDGVYAMDELDEMTAELVKVV